MTPEILVGGFAFLEGPRWRDNALWMSDMHGDAVYRVTLDGKFEKILDVPDQPSGLGWLADGSMLIVSMMDKKILRRSSSGDVAIHADISALVPERINEMHVDGTGRAWVGNFGFDLDAGDTPTTTNFVRVDPDGSAAIVAEEMMFPNGTVTLGGDKTLVVAETFGRRLTAFDIGSDGRLSNRRTWADMPERAVPDGICLDAKGGIWVASPTTGDAFRVVEGGEVTARVETGRMAIATALGGDDGKTLFILTSEATARPACKDAISARVEYVTVDIPAAKVAMG